ncbi:hypothetical protein ACAX43_09375 [Paraburkholderia sp. IW21]|uniref:hypothetical protein n=1 Tax=Paraburkholderia sp. IW21 TaxID=3242488 RepID=UPI0035212639
MLNIGAYSQGCTKIKMFRVDDFANARMWCVTRLKDFGAGCRTVRSFPANARECGFAPGWRMHGTEAALLVPIDLFQRAFMCILNDPGVDAPGRVS